MLYGIYDIFLTSEITEYGRGNSVLEKKLDKGDRTWAYKKYRLVCIFNGQDYTLRLPAEKIKKRSNVFTISISSRQKNLEKF